MINEVAEIQEIDILHIDPLIPDHLQFHRDHLKTLVFDIAIVTEISIPIELRHVQDTLTFKTNEGALDLFTILLSEKVSIVFFSRCNSRN